ncbi:MAG TPA: hypothetical protein VK837_09915, partial [Longimicrobiales bacterium]|nr:hypothetical protein [Longimicrobiales bacterium]
MNGNANRAPQAPPLGPRAAALRLLPLLSLMAAAGCASTGATLGSGVGDAYLEHPPYYAGAPAGATAPGRLGHLPIAYQRGAAQAAPFFDPELSGPVVTLLARMNEALDELDLSLKLAEGGSVSAVTHAATRYPPDVMFGCITPSLDPEDDCAERGDSALGRGDQRMRLAVGRPSPEWVSWIAETMARADVDATLVLTLEVGHYLPRQRGWRGTKEVELGNGYTVRLPWLTSLETPVSVIQLTGAIVGSDGKARRIGAEGMLARRTSLGLSSFGAQELIT